MSESNLPAPTWRVKGGRLIVTLSTLVEGNSLSMTSEFNSNETRALALEILSNQGPFLTYQPPNTDMQESWKTTPWRRKKRRPSVGARAWVRDAVKYHEPGDLYAALLQNDE